MTTEQEIAIKVLEKELQWVEYEGDRLNAEFVNARDRLRDWQERHTLKQRELREALKRATKP